ncbi:anti-sigma factor [Patescibacteria group bacterium]
MTNLNKGNTKLIILGIIFLVLVGGGYVYYQNQLPATSINNGSKGGEDSTLIDVDKMSGDDIMAMVIDNENSLTGQLLDVSGGNSKGSAYLLRKDGVIYHYVEANLPELGSGLAYEGWLVNKTPSLEFFSTGVMDQSNGVYTLSYSSDGEYPGYDSVVITLETKVDATPEKHIIEGVVR